MSASSDKRFYILQLKIEECMCGEHKKRGLAFCFRCYKSLPTDMKRELYQPVGNGFEEAYDEAVKYLT